MCKLFIATNPVITYFMTILWVSFHWDNSSWIKSEVAFSQGQFLLDGVGRVRKYGKKQLVLCLAS